MKTSITLNKQDIEEIIAQQFGVDVNCVTLSTPTETVGHGSTEREERTIVGVVNLDLRYVHSGFQNPGLISKTHKPTRKDIKEV